MDLTGQSIADRYEILRLLGEGGMGQVYEARHMELDKRVAIKVLGKELVEDDELRERFRREARITASLRHVNIIEVMDFGLTTDGQPYIVMELLSGESLGEVLEREGSLDQHEARRIMGQVLSGLAEAHARGIIHRDLKPDNVFIDEIKGQGQVVRLLDFGISKICGIEQEDLQLTKTGTVMGTPYYMAPEQVMGDETLDARLDLYACGVMLYEMLTGRRPFDGSTHNEVVVRIMSDEPPDPRAIRPEIDPGLAAVIRKAMSRDRDARFPSAEAFASALSDASYRPSTETFEPLSLTHDGPGQAASNRPWLLPAAIGGGLLVMTLIVTALAGVFLLRGCSGGGVVTITPRGIPDRANIILDGTLLPPEPFTLPRGDEPVTFSVEAPGYEPARFEVVPNEDQQVRVALQKKNQTTVHPGTSGDEKATEEKSSKKKSRKKKIRNPFKKLARELKN